MENEDHQQLAQYIKEVHLDLRKLSTKLGHETAWKEHCAKKDVLLKYAQSMKKLATTYWENNCANDSYEATSRIEWAAKFCYEYFINQMWTQYRDKELTIVAKLNIGINYEEMYTEPLKLIDVGSCYNPFKNYPYFDVFAIDLCPANDSVLECDFLTVYIGTETVIKNSIVKQIQRESFDVVTFCFVLEYIPTSELRISACTKAYSILKPGGLLIINTPDSKHVGANAKLMKCWRYTLSHIGFNRIKYDKFKHMHCMAFRRCLDKSISERWASLHKEPYMDYAINIPQDFQQQNEIDNRDKNTDKDSMSNTDYLKEMVFCDIE